MPKEPLRDQSHSARLAWTLRRDNVLEFVFELGGEASISLGVAEGWTAEEPGYSIELTAGDAESLAAALTTWSQS